MTDTPDYSAQNEPNEDELSAMMDSALALANALGSPNPQAGPRRWRGQANPDMSVGEYREYLNRTRHPDGRERYYITEPNGSSREVSEREYDEATREARTAYARGVPFRAPPVKKEQPPPPERAAIYAEAMAKALAEPSVIGVGAEGIIERSVMRIEGEVRTIRGVAGLEDHPIVRHALTSIELGLLGLARVVGHE